MLSDDNIEKFVKYSSLKNNVVIIGDSLSMPRPDEELLYEETYPYLLNEMLNGKLTVINRGKRTNTIYNQALDQNIYDDIIFFYPKYVVVQLGIVDCAPRLFNRRINAFFISRIRPHWLRKLVIMPFSKNRRFFTRYFPKQYVTLKDFRKYYDNLLKIITAFNMSPILVNIAKTSSRNEERSYGFDRNIRSYNAIITELANKYACPLIDVYNHSQSNDIILLDGIHYNKEGSKFIAQGIYSFITERSKI